MPVILIGGTWDNVDTDIKKIFWWKPGSSFYYGVVKHGYKCYSFSWNTKLDGLVGKNAHWDSAAGRLVNVCPENPIIIAHSHGGQLPIIAAANGLRIKSLVTLGTPVRKDMPYKEAKANIGFWTHIYGNRRDYMQLLGSLMIGKFWVLKRSIKEASLNIHHPVSHSKLHDVEIWNEQNWWKFLRLGWVPDK